MDRKQERRRVAQQFVLLRMVHGTDPADVFAVDQRFDFVVKVSALAGVLRLSGKHDRQTDFLRDANRVERVFFRAKAVRGTRGIPRARSTGRRRQKSQPL